MKIDVKPFIETVKGELPDGALYFRGIRLREGLTQKQLAQRLKVSTNLISRIETGKIKIPDALASAFQNEFGTRPNLFRRILAFFKKLL